jgi:hypothetical protein
MTGPVWPYEDDEGRTAARQEPAPAPSAGQAPGAGVQARRTHSASAQDGNPCHVAAYLRHALTSYQRIGALPPTAPRKPSRDTGCCSRPRGSRPPRSSPGHTRGTPGKLLTGGSPGTRPTAWERARRRRGRLTPGLPGGGSTKSGSELGVRRDLVAGRACACGCRRAGCQRRSNSGVHDRTVRSRSTAILTLPGRRAGRRPAAPGPVAGLTGSNGSSRAPCYYSETISSPGPG